MENEKVKAKTPEEILQEKLDFIPDIKTAAEETLAFMGFVGHNLKVEYEKEKRSYRWSVAISGFKDLVGDSFSDHVNPKHLRAYFCTLIGIQTSPIRVQGMDLIMAARWFETGDPRLDSALELLYRLEIFRRRARAHKAKMSDLIAEEFHFRHNIESLTQKRKAKHAH